MLKSFIMLATAALGTVPAMAQSRNTAPASPALDRYHVPGSMSPQAQAALRQIYAAQAKARPQPKPTKLADWDAANAAAIAAIEPLSAQAMTMVGASAQEDRIAGVPVLRIKPANYQPGTAPLIYVHGGGWVTLSAKSLRGDTALFATATGREIISVDYRLAPRGNWQIVTDQVVAVWRALLAKGFTPGAMGLTGGSAGGNIVLASTLKMRDQGLPLPGAIYVASPATDLSLDDDTLYTLAGVDPTLDARILPWVAEAYAGTADRKNPYISPVYGDYSKPFPPTLIQVGTREQLLSSSVREYQAIRAGGHEAVLDVYEGTPHGFPALLATTPEAQTAIARAAAFFKQHLSQR